MKSICLAVLCVTAFACSDETELKKSVFIRDETSPELPQYSEWGYNTFGAYYDRQPFVSSDFDVPVKVIHKNNGTSFLFSGEKLSNVRSTRFSITFILSDFHPQTYADLIALHNTTIDLTVPGREVFITDGSRSDTVQIISGELNFVRAQHLLVDEQPEEVILSGVFEFQILVDGMNNAIPFFNASSAFLLSDSLCVPE